MLRATHTTAVQRNRQTQIQNITNLRIGNTEADFEIRPRFDLHLNDINVRIGKTESI